MVLCYRMVTHFQWGEGVSMTGRQILPLAPCHVAVYSRLHYLHMINIQKGELNSVICIEQSNLVLDSPSTPFYGTFITMLLSGKIGGETMVCDLRRCHYMWTRH
jgi:hypothetical protein